MNRSDDTQQEHDPGNTSPPDPTHEATTPPSNPPADEGEVERGKDRLEQAGGGH